MDYEESVVRGSNQVGFWVEGFLFVTHHKREDRSRNVRCNHHTKEKTRCRVRGVISHGRFHYTNNTSHSSHNHQKPNKILYVTRNRIRKAVQEKGNRSIPVPQVVRAVREEVCFSSVQILLMMNRRISDNYLFIHLKSGS